MTTTEQPTDTWSETMRAVADGELPEPPGPVDWYELASVEGSTLDWSIVRAGDSSSGRRLLVVELDDAAEERVLDALEVLAGRG